MSALDQILDCLDGVQETKNGWQARCPAHEDQHPSLSIAESNGNVLLNCHAGCSIERICESLGITRADLFSAPTSTNLHGTPKDSLIRRRRQDAKPKKGLSSRDQAATAMARSANGSVENVWTYVDANGRHEFSVVRIETAKGKTFRPVYESEGVWYVGDPPGALPLYRLTELRDAERVYVTEGEKAADAARSLGLVATTSAHGSQSAHKSDWSPLAGKDVVILPDNDEAGSHYAEVVAKTLEKLEPQANVKVVALPDLPEHGDIVDWVESHPDASSEHLRHMVEQLADQVEPSSECAQEVEYDRFHPFPVAVLPEPVRAFVNAGADAIGCDPSFVAMPVLAVLGAAIGNTRRIQLKRGWNAPPIIWTAIVGESGTAKTPAFRLAMRAIRDKEGLALKQYEQGMSQFQTDMAHWEKAMAAWKRDKKSASDPPAKPELPPPVRNVVSDTTIEALAPLLLVNPRGLLLARDELAGWIGSFDRYASGQGADSANWLSMHNGESVIVDRKTGQPKTIYVPQAAVCITGGIQPGILQRALGTEHRESGLAARLLLAYPPRQAKRWTEADIDPMLEGKFAILLDRLYELESAADDEGHSHATMVFLKREAKQAWVDFYNTHAREQASLSGDLASVWSKLEEYAARLALIVHMVRWCVDGTSVDHDALDAKSMEAGIALTRWFGNEACRVYARLAESDEECERRQLIELIQRRNGAITPRELAQASRRYWEFPKILMFTDRERWTESQHIMMR